MAKQATVSLLHVFVMLGLHNVMAQVSPEGDQVQYPGDHAAIPIRAAKGDEIGKTGSASENGISGHSCRSDSNATDIKYDGLLPKFGRGMRSDFSLAPDYINLNSVSVGAYPNWVRQELAKIELHVLERPDMWLRSGSKPEIAKARRVLGKLMNCDEDDLVMVPNTTGGINAVLRNLQYTPGDRIFHLNTLYASIQGIVRYVLDKNKGILSPLVLDIEYPMNSTAFLEKFERFVKESQDPSKPIRVAVIDHVSSMPTIVNPIEKMIQILKSYDIPVLVDAAHAIGQLKIDVRKWDPDYYVSNVNKWGMAPCPAAVLYVKKENQGMIHPAIVSQYYRVPSDFQMEFWWPGVWDDLHYVAVPFALEYRRRIGGEDRIMEYNNKLARQGALMVAKLLGTRLLQDADQMGSMGDVRLPFENPENPNFSLDWFVNLQLTKYPNMYTPVYKHNGNWWARLSAQVYNDMSDYEMAVLHLRDIIKEADALSD